MKAEMELLRTARDVMTAPVVSCSAQATARQVAALLVERGVSSAVVAEEDGRLAGLVTERDLVEKVLARAPGLPPAGGGPDAEVVTAGEVMNPEPVAVGPETPFFEVLLTMVRRRVKHILVADQGRVLGIVTVRDLMKSRDTGVLSIVREMEDQRTVAGLARTAQEVDQVLKAVVTEGAPLPELLSLVTEFYDRLARKALELGERELAEEGSGPPPCRYCWLALGSAGRREQIFRTDQDNALLYEEVPAGQADEARRYFLRLGEKTVAALEACGFARCKGGVMASTPRWCRSLLQWQQALANWTRHPEPEHVRLLGIFLDFRPVHGALDLAADLRTHVNDLFASFPVILRMLAEDDAASRVPVGPWGLVIPQWRGEHRGFLNLKTAVAVHLVDELRLLALKHRIAETSTLGRLRESVAFGIFEEEEGAELEEAYRELMSFRLRHSLAQVAAGRAPDDWLEVKSLTRSERKRLLSVLRTVARLQDLTARSFLVY